MANQTVSQSLNLDNLALRQLLNGEALTILTGSRLTINSDPQWSAQSASLGDLFINDGEVYIDGTTIREINFINGTGLPALEQYISGTSGLTGGEIIKVVGSAASGSIKIRQLLGGTGRIDPNEPFDIYNSTTSSIVFTATASDRGDFVTSLWVWGTELRAINVQRTGKLTVTGTWLPLGISNGTANQTMNLPSGTNCPWPTVWVETASGTNQYEPWVNAGSMRWVTGQIGNNPYRGHFFSQSAAIAAAGTFLNWNDIIGFGNGTTIGRIPPSQSRVQIPNVWLSSTTAAQRAANRTTLSTTTTTRWETQTTASGIVDMRNCVAQGLFLNLQQPYSVYLENVDTFQQVQVGEAPSAVLKRVNVGIYNSQSSNPCLNLVTNQSLNIEGGLYSINLTTNNSWTHQFTTNNNVFVSGTVFHAFAKGGTAHRLVYINTCTNVTMSSCTTIGAETNIAASDGVYIFSQSHSDRSSGSDQTTTAQYSCLVNVGSKNVTFEAYTGSGAQPRLELYALLNTTNVKIKNIGTWNNPFNFENQTNTVLNLQGSNQNTEMSRVYVRQTRASNASFITTTNSNTRLLMQNVFTDGNDGYNQTTLNVRARGLRLGSGTLGAGNGITSALVAVYGSHFYNIFITNTSGAVGIHPLEQTSDIFSTGSYIVTTGSPAFNSAGGALLRTSQDELEWTWPWYVLGYTAFANQVSQSSGVGVDRLLFTYAIDTGSGVFSTFKTGSTANFVNETISPTNGFKLKIRAKCITTNPANTLTGYIIPMVTTAAAQSGALYPLEEINTNLTLTGLQSGSEVRVYRRSDNLELAGVEDGSGSFSYPYVWTGADQVVDLIIHAISYEYIRFDNISLGRGGLTIPIQQRFDRNYSNP